MLGWRCRRRRQGIWRSCFSDCSWWPWQKGCCEGHRNGRRRRWGHWSRDSASYGRNTHAFITATTAAAATESPVGRGYVLAPGTWCDWSTKLVGFCVFLIDWLLSSCACRCYAISAFPWFDHTFEFAQDILWLASSPQNSWVQNFCGQLFPRLCPSVECTCWALQLCFLILRLQISTLPQTVICMFSVLISCMLRGGVRGGLAVFGS